MFIIKEGAGAVVPGSLQCCHVGKIKAASRLKLTKLIEFLRLLLSWSIFLVSSGSSVGWYIRLSVSSNILSKLWSCAVGSRIIIISVHLLHQQSYLVTLCRLEER